MNQEITNMRQPYDFGRAIFLVFRSGEGSLAFILKSALFYAVVVVIMFWLFGGMVIRPYAEIIRIAMEAETGNATDAEVAALMVSSMGSLMLGALVIGLGMWVVWAMIESALHRRVLLGESNNGIFPWRLGVDEGRTMLCQLVNYLAYMGLYMVFYIVLLVGILITGVLGTQSAALGVVGGLLTFFLVGASIVIMAQVLIRLAPAAALSAVRNRIAIGEVWPVVKGRMWPTFGAYVFHYIVSVNVIYIFILILFMAFFGGSFMEFITAADQMSEEQIWAGISSYFDNPGVKLKLVICGLVSGLLVGVWMMCMAGVATYATELYIDKNKEEGVEVFD